MGEHIPFRCGPVHGKGNPRYGKGDGGVGCTAPQPHKTLQGFELYYGKLRAPCISMPACYWRWINLGVAAKILGVHEYLKINSRYCGVPRKAFAVNGRQRTSKGCSSFLTPPHGSLLYVHFKLIFLIPTVGLHYQPCQSRAQIMNQTSVLTLAWPSQRDPGGASTNCFSKLVGTCRLPTTLGNFQQ